MEYREHRGLTLSAIGVGGYAAVGLGRVAEDAVRPAFFDLWPLQGRLESAGPALEEIRRALRRVIPEARP